MRLWTGKYDSVKGKELLFISGGLNDKEVPFVLHHGRDGGFFKRENSAANFACDRCRATIRMAVVDGMDCSPDQVVSALDEPIPRTTEPVSGGTEAAVDSIEGRA